MFRRIDGQVFDGYSDGLEEEEPEGTVYQPPLVGEFTGEVEDGREEEGDVELGVSRPIGATREF